MRVYFAGPLFTPYERSFIDECAGRLRADGIDVFVPHENALAAGDMSAATISAKDWKSLSDADAVVAVLDGPMVDDGTACEIGIFCSCSVASTRRGKCATRWTRSPPSSTNGASCCRADPYRNAAPDLTDESRWRDGRLRVAGWSHARDGFFRNDGHCRSAGRRLNAFLPPCDSLKDGIPSRSSFVFVFTQHIGEQSAGVGSPGCFGIA